MKHYKLYLPAGTPNNVRMELLQIITLIFIGSISFNKVVCSTSDADYIYFHGNSSKNVVYKSFNRRNIKFFMYTRSRPNGFRLSQDAQSLSRSGFDNSNPTKFLIHGYMGSYRSNSIQMPKNAYMASGDYNVVAVDWSAYAFPYAVAVNSVPSVGSTVGSMMAFMSERGGMDTSDVHVVGHSLGAHIAGYTGKSVRNRWKKGKRGKGSRNGRVSRITGLDPAAPAFSHNPPSQRLSSDDAQFVDVIHTSIRLLGMAKNIGHADFYPNGGKNQPQCPSHAIEQATGFCDHGQSYVYFSQSIRNRHLFPSVGCNSVQEAKERRCSGDTKTYMGEGADSSFISNHSDLSRGPCDIPLAQNRLDLPLIAEDADPLTVARAQELYFLTNRARFFRSVGGIYYVNVNHVKKNDRT